MVYKIVTARILDDGSVAEGARKMLHSSPVELVVGGLYFLGPNLPGRGKLYRVVEQVG